MTPLKPVKMRRPSGTFITLTLIASFTLSACGIRGSLKTPPPIWGDGVSPPAQTPADSSADNPNTTNKTP